MRQAPCDDVTPEPNLIGTMARSLAILIWPYPAMMLCFYLDQIGILRQRLNPAMILLIAGPAMFFFLPFRNIGTKLLFSLLFVPILSVFWLMFFRVSDIRGC